MQSAQHNAWCSQRCIHVTAAMTITTICQVALLAGAGQAVQGFASQTCISTFPSHCSHCVQCYSCLKPVISSAEEAPAGVSQTWFHFCSTTVASLELRPVPSPVWAQIPPVSNEAYPAQGLSSVNSPLYPIGKLSALCADPLIV